MKKISDKEFSFKGYDQQPPGFSKPGFFLSVLLINSRMLRAAC
jgi:hypothetical protein